MANRFTGNVDRKDIHEQLVLVEGSSTDYITPSGKIYKLYPNGKYHQKKTSVNKYNGYVYVGITMADGSGNKNKRVHRLLAIAFLPNPDNLPVVGHKDNNKSNNSLDNLYWTTVQENTQKAFDDGLAVNAKSYEDSQSKEVIVFDLHMNEIARYGSISECSRELGVSKNAISGQCNGDMKTKPRCGYYFKFAD